MEGYIGIIEEIRSTQAKIRITDPNYKSSKRVIEAWNNISAKVGEKVLVEERYLDNKKILSMTLGIPVMSAIAGFVFGGVMAGYFNADIWMCRGISTALWLVASLIYTIPLRKNVAANQSSFVVTKVVYD